MPIHLVPSRRPGLLLDNDPQAMSLAREWTRLRQKAQVERDPTALAAILNSLETVVDAAKRLLRFNDDHLRKD